jgi:hypothetical protein
MEKETDGKFEGWMFVEIMGHKRLAGYVTEEERFGIVMLRIDIPTGIDAEKRFGLFTTQYYHHSAIFCVTPILESDALELAKDLRPRPFSEFNLHKESQIIKPGAIVDPDFDEVDEEPY